MTCFISAALILSVSGPAQALAKTEVRLLHAVPGGPSAELSLGSSSTSSVAFAGATTYAIARRGEVRLRLVAGGETIASRTANLADGSYTAVAMPSGQDVTLRVFRDGKPEAGRARLRAIHAAPELDRAVFSAGSTRLGTLGPGQDGDYVTADPGSYELTAARPGGGDPLLEQDVTLPAGVAQTAVAVGSGGEPTRFVILPDGASAPRQGPATGLGGLADDETPWLPALLAGLVAGLLGLGGFTLASRRRAHDG